MTKNPPKPKAAEPRPRDADRSQKDILEASAARAWTASPSAPGSTSD
jgi:hypothetical protein